jgi:hypothetical protein
MAITPDDRLVFATMTGYGYITSWRLNGNVLSIAKDTACPKVPGDGTFRGIGGIVGIGPNDIWLNARRCLSSTRFTRTPRNWWATPSNRMVRSTMSPARAFRTTARRA